MTRISLGLVTLLALSSAVSIVNAHEGHDHAQQKFNIPGDEEYSANAPELQDFKATSIKAPFLEQFADNWTARWTASEATKETTAEGEVFSYVGQWNVEEPTVYPGMKGDKGLVAKSPAAHHAISASLPEVVDNKDKTLVVQYEVKAQTGLECGGAYMKLLTDSPEGIKFKEFSNDTPYTIMFGPDKCGGTNKVHFIFRHKNPITGVYEEKHLQSAPLAKLGSLTNLYTLIVKPDQTYEIKINGESASSGSLLEDFQPPVNPPKEIDDPTDSKPADWVETAQIPDPKATKPADWDEDAPARILDEKAVKPSDWLEDELAEIPDPDAVKPEDWDDEEDGDWVPVSVPNPKCESNGCGKWVRPYISNPAYKGKWSAPLIDNPEYKGVWAPRKIANPAFFEDLHPSNFEKIGAVGFEIWTMQKDILFDNIYIGHSVADAEALAAETWEIKHAAEKKQEELANPKPKSLEGLPSFKEDPVGFLVGHLREFIELAREDPMNAIHSRPMVSAVLAAIIGVTLGLGLILVGLLTAAPRAGTPRAASKAKKTDEVTADDQDNEVKPNAEGKSGSKDEAALRKRTTVVEETDE
ncbi:Calreticulin-domain-containing protein [Linnemannia elongata AG-77]|uniref:Calreticulin-domain-containing protein n=1 Tax=Linnemannia elongata AG-77 TaxID=1314771 RepID=A0A197JKR6_9FUNG|nr:Calreticulin-domain-containing protein [Linnemannia elongata AG-77]